MQPLIVHIGSGHATCLRFNRKGDFLASGRVDGTVVIFDIETNGVARKLRGHIRQMQSLRQGYQLTTRWRWLMGEVGLGMDVIFLPRHRIGNAFYGT